LGQLLVRLRLHRCSRRRGVSDLNREKGQRNKNRGASGTRCSVKCQRNHLRLSEVLDCNKRPRIFLCGGEDDHKRHAVRLRPERFDPAHEEMHKRGKGNERNVSEAPRSLRTTTQRLVGSRVAHINQCVNDQFQGERWGKKGVVHLYREQQMCTAIPLVEGRS